MRGGEERAGHMRTAPMGRRVDALGGGRLDGACKKIYWGRVEGVVRGKASLDGEMVPPVGEGGRYRRDFEALERGDWWR